MTMDKQCVKCREVKRFEEKEKKHSKASGFHGNRCWSCYVESHRDIPNNSPRGGEPPPINELEVLRTTSAAIAKAYSDLDKQHQQLLQKYNELKETVRNSSAPQNQNAV